MILSDDCFCRTKWWFVILMVVYEEVVVNIGNNQMVDEMRPLDLQVSKRESLDFEC